MAIEARDLDPNIDGVKAAGSDNLFSVKLTPKEREAMGLPPEPEETNGAEGKGKKKRGPDYALATDEADQTVQTDAVFKPEEPLLTEVPPEPLTQEQQSVIDAFDRAAKQAEKAKTAWDTANSGIKSTLKKYGYNPETGAFENLPEDKKQEAEAEFKTSEKEAKEALNELRKTEIELEAAIGKLQAMEAPMGKGSPDVLDALKDLKSSLSHIQSQRAGLEAELRMAALGYPHNIKQILANIDKVGSAAAAKAEDASAAVETAYTESKAQAFEAYAEADVYLDSNKLRDHMMRHYAQKYGETTVNDVLDFYKQSDINEMMAEAARRGGAEGRRIVGETNELLFSFQQSYNQTEKGKETKRDEARISEVDKRQLLDLIHQQIDRIRKFAPEQAAAIERSIKKYSREHIHGDIYKELQAVGSADDASQAAIYTDKRLQERHDELVADAMTSAARDNPEAFKAWREEQERQGRAPDGKYKLWHVEKSEAEAIIAKMNTSANAGLTPLEIDKLKMYALQENARYNQNREALVDMARSLGKLKDLTTAISQDGKGIGYDLAPHLKAFQDPNVQGAPRVKALEGLLEAQLAISHKTGDNSKIQSAQAQLDLVRNLMNSGNGVFLARRLANAKSIEEISEVLAKTPSLNEIGVKLGEASPEQFLNTQRSKEKFAEDIYQYNKQESIAIRQTVAELKKQAPTNHPIHDALKASAGSLSPALYNTIKAYQQGVLNDEAFRERLRSEHSLYVAAGNEVKEAVLQAYKQESPANYEAIARYLELSKPNAVTNLDISVIRKLDEAEYLRLKSKVDRANPYDKHAGLQALSEDERQRYLLHEFVTSAELTAGLTTAVQSYARDVQVYGSRFKEDFLNHKGVEARLEHLQRMGMIPDNDPQQKEVVRKFLTAIDGKENAFFTTFDKLLDPKTRAEGMKEMQTYLTPDMAKTPSQLALEQAVRQANKAADQAVAQYLAANEATVRAMAFGGRVEDDGLAAGGDFVKTPQQITQDYLKTLYDETYNKQFALTIEAIYRNNPEGYPGLKLLLDKGKEAAKQVIASQDPLPIEQRSAFGNKAYADIERKARVASGAAMTEEVKVKAPIVTIQSPLIANDTAKIGVGGAPQASNDNTNTKPIKAENCVQEQAKQAAEGAKACGTSGAKNENPGEKTPPTASAPPDPNKQVAAK